MVLAAVLTPLLAIGLLIGVVALLPTRYVAGLVIALFVGVLVNIKRHRKQRRIDGQLLTRVEDPELFALVERLCALAEIAVPDLVLRNERQPNSWVVHMPNQVPRLYLTTGLRELLSPAELSAVLAHELSHIANRDALVMSVVGMPTRVMTTGFWGGGIDTLFMNLIGWFSMIGVSLLSRYRELAADAGSAAITGRPSALASALLKVSDSMQQVPVADLRAAQKLNAFNLVAVNAKPGRRRRSRLAARLFATHPPLQTRVDALYALERRAQHD
jgi:heat shock protein HtpX